MLTNYFISFLIMYLIIINQNEVYISFFIYFLLMYLLNHQKMNFIQILNLKKLNFLLMLNNNMNINKNI